MTGVGEGAESPSLEPDPIDLFVAELFGIFREINYLPLGDVIPHVQPVGQGPIANDTPISALVSGRAKIDIYTVGSILVSSPMAQDVIAEHQLETIGMKIEPNLDMYRGKS